MVCATAIKQIKQRNFIVSDKIILKKQLDLTKEIEYKIKPVSSKFLPWNKHLPLMKHPG